MVGGTKKQNKTKIKQEQAAAGNGFFSPCRFVIIKHTYCAAQQRVHFVANGNIEAIRFFFFITRAEYDKIKDIKYKASILPVYECTKGRYGGKAASRQDGGRNVKRYQGVCRKKTGFRH